MWMFIYVYISAERTRNILHIRRSPRFFPYSPLNLEMVVNCEEKAWILQYGKLTVTKFVCRFLGKVVIR